MYRLTLPLVLALLLKVSYSLFANENKQLHSKVLLITENKLNQNFLNVDQRFSNTLSAKLADVRMGIITPDTITSKIDSSNQQELRSIYQELNKNNKLTLARQMGANAILSVNLNSYTKKRADIPKFDRSVVTFTLVSDYRFISVSNGSAFAGESFSVEKKIPITSQVGLSFSEDVVLSELIEQTVDLISKNILNSDFLESEMASKFKNSSSNQVKNPLVEFGSEQKLVSVTISANFKNMSMPEIISGKDGKITLSGNILEVSPGDAEILINGLVVGMCSKDGQVKVPEGICRLQIKRSGFEMEEKLINAYEGMTLSFTLKPTNEEYDRWHKQIRFLQEIKAGEIFNQNQIKLTEGMFEFLKNSKYEVPEINLNKSLFQ